jgi:DNA-binding MarR family transcriptional regulator
MNRLLKRFIHYLELQENPSLKSIIDDLDLKENELVILIKLLEQKGIHYQYMNVYIDNKKDLIKILKKGD